MKREFINLFEKTKNPIESDEVIEKIVEAYSQRDFLYDSIVKIGAEGKQVHDYPVRDMDVLYSSLFNIWKHNMLDVSNFDEKKEVLKENYDDLIKQLSNISDIHTYKEFCQINNDYPLINENGMLYPDFHWVYLSSRYINGTRRKDMNIQYRLYINTGSNDLYRIVSFFIYNCYKNNLPFNLKFVKHAQDLSRRADSIVIWADENTLFKYLKILNNFQNMRPDIVSRCNSPSILTTTLNDWIGFGEEPIESSYTEYRTQLIEDSIEKAMVDWAERNKNTVIDYGKGKLTVNQYITARIVKETIIEIKREFDREKNSVLVKYGLQKEELNNELCIKICKEINNEIISALKRGEIKIDYIDGSKKITFMVLRAKRIIYDMLMGSSNNKKEFFESIKNNIKNGCKQYGISSKNFAFNIQYEQEVKKTKNTERGK